MQETTDHRAVPEQAVVVAHRVLGNLKNIGRVQNSMQAGDDKL